MLFNSLSFFIFFPVVTLLYFITPHRWRWLLLLVASCIFYMAFIPAYILILAYLILVDYFAAIFIEKVTGKKKFILLLLSIFSNIGILFFFKYYNFFQGSVSSFGHFIHWNYSPSLLQLILPIGLSFHTFQSLSYVIEVYKKKYKAEKHFGIYALYVMFYPQLVAGPIERPKELLPQFYIKHKFDDKRVSEGLRRMLFGLFKKLVIADRLAILVNHVYGNPHDYIGFPLILATVAFAFQVYCDFSGYSDIAIGAANVMGFKLRENFNHPYLATSIPDFWRRWHMSLYSWFRDYIYIPLGGNRAGKLLQIRNILIVFFVTGLWHGASWNYVVWGLIHGIYMAAALVIGKFIPPIEHFRINKIAAALVYIGRVIITFSLICFAWIFFRAATFADGIYIATHAFIGLNGLVKFLFQGQFNYFMYLAFNQANKGIGLSLPQLGIAVGAIGFFGALYLIQLRKSFPAWPVWGRWAIYVLLTLLVINLGPANEVPFIYFQF